MSCLGSSPVQEPYGPILKDSFRGKSPGPSANRLRPGQHNGIAGKPPGYSQTTSTTPVQQRAEPTPSHPPFVRAMTLDESTLRAVSTRMPSQLDRDRNQDHGLKSRRSLEYQRSPHYGKCRPCRVRHSTTKPRLLSPSLRNSQGGHRQQRLR